MPKALEMFKERPLIGWGPVHHLYELGSRFGVLKLDTHNLYLWLLTETGLLGAIPFFIGLGICWSAAWKARDGIQGILPTAMIVFLLTINMAGTWHNRKLFWIVLAYGLASYSFVAPRWRWRRSVRVNSRQPRKGQMKSPRPARLRIGVAQPCRPW